MKLLLDHNLSPKLVTRLGDLFPGSTHTQLIGLATADDATIWDRARSEGYVIVSKDDDFNHLSVVRGWPPKVVWLLLGNCTTAQVEAAIRRHVDDLRQFAAADLGTLAIA